MKVHECIEISRPILEAMRRAGVNLDDVKYLEMYKRFLAMKGEGLKVLYLMCQRYRFERESQHAFAVELARNAVFNMSKIQT